MNVWQLVILEFAVSFIAPYIWTRNPRTSLFIAVTNVLLMVGLADMLGMV